MLWILTDVTSETFLALPAENQQLKRTNITILQYFHAQTNAFLPYSIS